MSNSQRTIDMDDSNQRQFVTFSLNGECYAVDILSVREIRAKSVPTNVPNSHPQIVGVINLRGAIIPVVDLRVAFGLRSTAAADGNAIVIASHKQQLTGLLVDEVLDIVSVRPDEISALPGSANSEQSRLFNGLVTSDTQITAILNLEHLLSTEHSILPTATAAA